MEEKKTTATSETACPACMSTGMNMAQVVDASGRETGEWVRTLCVSCGGKGVIKL